MIVELKVRKLILTCNSLALLYFVSWFAHQWHTNMHLPIPRDNGLGKIHTHRKTQETAVTVCTNSSAGKETALTQVCPHQRVLFRHTGLADVSFKKRVWGACLSIPCLRRKEAFSGNVGKINNHPPPFFPGNWLGNFALERHLEENSEHMRPALSSL